MADDITASNTNVIERFWAGHFERRLKKGV